MARLCGGAHEISGIKAPLFLCGGWLEGSWGGWVGGWWWWDGSWGGWVVGQVMVGWVGVGHGLGGCWWGGSWVGGWCWGASPQHPHHGGCHMPPMLFFDNLVKKLDQIVKKQHGGIRGCQMPP